MRNLNIIFMGTPDFACGILETLINSRHNVIGVVSQPDKKVGRKQILTPTPVKQLALDNNIEVFQPINIKNDKQWIFDLNPDLIVTCAYGQMISDDILNFPEFGSLNVHASLLPKLRGGAPIHKAIIDGYDKTGVSIMRMVKKMDAGDYMMQGIVDIDINDTTGSLHDKLMECGSNIILDAIDELIEGNATFIKQNEEEATYAYNISKEEEKIDFSKDYKDVYNQIRGLIPWPVAYMVLDDKKIKIHKVKLSDIKCKNEAGKLLYKNKQLYLSCLNGCLEILELQKEGKKKSDAISYIAGNKEKLIELK